MATPACPAYGWPAQPVRCMPPRNRRTHVLAATPAQHWGAANGCRTTSQPEQPPCGRRPLRAVGYRASPVKPRIAEAGPAGLQPHAQELARHHPTLHSECVHTLPARLADAARHGRVASCAHGRWHVAPSQHWVCAGRDMSCGCAAVAHRAGVGAGGHRRWWRAVNQAGPHTWAGKTRTAVWQVCALLRGSIAHGHAPMRVAPRRPCLGIRPRVW